MNPKSSLSLHPPSPLRLLLAGPLALLMLTFGSNGAAATRAAATRAAATRSPASPTPSSSPAPETVPRLPAAAVALLPAPRAPAPATLDAGAAKQAAALLEHIKRWHLYSDYRSLACLYEAQNCLASAEAVHREEAARYRRQGLADAAEIEDTVASGEATQLNLFVDGGLSSAGSPSPTWAAPAPLEPLRGCYLGAFIDRDNSLGPPTYDENWGLHRTPQQFAAATGRHPGSLFTYLAYGQPFPARWVAMLKAQGVVPQIAWEPQSLNQVRDDAYLNAFARACRNAAWPLFIRFASEMNGYWTPYHSDPAAYRSAFRLVNRVLHRWAPLAATIWCISNPPGGDFMTYYPGDDACDWVGVNFYSVPWHENRPGRPAFHEDPLARLDPVYRAFAGRKPIAVCEYAASHESPLNHRPIPDFACRQLNLVFGALPLLYPRVHLIDWFDMDSMRYPTPGKTLNDYTLTSNSGVTLAWNRATASPWFLSQYLRPDSVPPPQAAPVCGQTIDDNAVLHLWARSYDFHPTATLTLDNSLLGRASFTGAWSFRLNTERFVPGRHVLSVTLCDRSGHLLRSIRATLVLRPPTPRAHT